MTDFFDYFVDKEYPEGATPEERQKVSEMLGELENEIFDPLPWLIQGEGMEWLKGKPHMVEMTDSKANEVVKAVYNILRKRK
jgi:O-acetyl-ADP-ribose deacetylase (regulator of RNase III)